ncbi:DUF1552 domain-containing protein [Lignipirellula cremea]|uniref:DUF1552 domain-containing protein n=1 Tax=Lignipirellula cremea TaxID=2528010 RepID=A0A518E4J4_9BACT|nr:DUF1552 domain-containing protein [Lignipirellula cremea]QDU99010.1 hypothetical protein Pla8534_69210 [Lignipirellula cremea]
MANKSWRLDRRTCLQGAGLALALPLLESMSFGAAAKTPPRRMAFVYFPFGVSMPSEDGGLRDWGWFPRGEGRDYQLTKPLQPLADLRDQITILGGLSHPRGRTLGGHDTGDTFLTGASLKGPLFVNDISLDQYAAQHIGDDTRYRSLILSSDGGVGEPTRSTTLSFSAKGKPIPALASPQQVFARLFGNDDAAQTERRKLVNTASMLDRVLDHSRSLRRQLGKVDQQKLDDYLASLRQVEQQVEQSQRWLDIPKPKVDAESIALDVDQKTPQTYLRTMYDLMLLAFQTDSTRLATYMIGQVAGATTIANSFPAAVGLEGNWHGLAHSGASDKGAEKLGRFDQFLAEHFAYFLKRLQSTPEGDGNMLDHTLVLYGSSNSKTHQNRNYPLIVAGGRKLGMAHGQYLQYTEETPLANLFVTMLDRANIPVESFADSTGELSQLLV